jgi:Icc-related predicted phosphoesterase
MRIIHISDTHGKHTKIKWPFDPSNADVIIHSGDFSNVGEEHGVRDFFKWFSGLNIPYKIVIPGNHDKSFDPKFWADKAPAEDAYRHLYRQAEHFTKEIVEEFRQNPNHYFLNHEGCEIEGVKFFGSPWSCEFHPRYWAFNIPRGEASKELYATLPDVIDVLITHGPSFERLDEVISGLRVGCEELAKRIKEIKPKYHLFGHIHEAYGVSFDGDTYYLNSSIMNLQYFPTNLPQIFEL